MVQKSFGFAESVARRLTEGLVLTNEKKNRVNPSACLWQSPPLAQGRLSVFLASLNVFLICLAFLNVFFMSALYKLIED